MIKQTPQTNYDPRGVAVHVATAPPSTDGPTAMSDYLDGLATVGPGLCVGLGFWLPPFVVMPASRVAQAARTGEGRSLVLDAARLAPRRPSLCVGAAVFTDARGAGTLLASPCAVVQTTLASTSTAVALYCVAPFTWDDAVAVYEHLAQNALIPDPSYRREWRQLGWSHGANSAIPYFSR